MADDDLDDFDWSQLGTSETVEVKKVARNLSEPVLFGFGFGEVR